MSKAPRATCPTCLGNYALRKNGSFYRHRYYRYGTDFEVGEICPASGHIFDLDIDQQPTRENYLMLKLTSGPPSKPYTRLTPEGIQMIEDRLGFMLAGPYDAEMAPALRNITDTLITQDLPALLDAVKNPECEDCASIHRVHHAHRLMA